MITQCHFCDDPSSGVVKSCCGHLTPICGECDRSAAQHAKCRTCRCELTPEKDRAQHEEYIRAQESAYDDMLYDDFDRLYDDARIEAERVISYDEDYDFDDL